MSADAEDKRQREWAKNYVLDPLTAPEPSQDCGPGSSFINPLRRALSTSTKGTTRGKQPAAGLRHKSSSSYPTAPTPASPTQANHLRRKPVPLPPSTGSPHSPKLPLNRGNSLKKPGHHLEETHRPQGNSNIGRSKTVQSRRPPQTHQTQGASTLDRSTSPSTTDELHYKGKGLRRASSLGGRYPGDMSHRPLDQIRKEQRAADRAPHLKVQKYPNTDTIDGLDSTTFGGVYHHGGPYDATLASRNHIKKYSPVEAVKDSNEKALQATPREYIEDSLRKHVPLQGTSFVPPGFPAMSGQVMMYEEGSDLQREREALGGAYKRYDFIDYEDDDLKGKGEPFYTLEKERKEKERLQKTRRRQSASSSGGVYEMQPFVDDSKNGNTRVRHRSLSAAPSGSRQSAGPSNAPPSPTGMSTNNDMHRSHTNGKKFEGLKRRLGSLRRKIDA